MGKKRVIKKSKEELLKERDKIEAAVRKDVQVKTSQKVRDGKLCIFSSYNNKRKCILILCIIE